MLVQITADELLNAFELWMLKQFGNNASTMENLRVHSIVDKMINDDLEYCANVTLWTLYDNAKTKLN